ncbi:DMT family transporter [Calidifontibacillus erzurumensis]|uniref:DMT family transporter n=1 Tax=Calidifontibacillus erzurumensis TaxID=2741433 RepID=A0A8J8GFL7_9BACI|nr:DMT family transporter [Calidifontibacillus erzurumensis]NSL52452.1 DMT family transporter [Calidifontibacillus erzurumensis]
MKPKISHYLALAIGAIAVSTSAILVKLSSAPAAITATYRLLLAVLLMLPFFSSNYLQELRSIEKKDWIYSIIAGVFLAFHFIFWFESLNYTSVASSVVLVTLQPIFAFIGTYFFYKERLTVVAVLSGLFAIIGSIIISWGDFQVSGMALLGDFLAIVAAIIVTAYFLFGQTVRKRLSLYTYTFIVYSISSITLIIYDLILGYSFFSYPMKDWIVFLLLAIIPTLLGHTLFNWAIKWLSTSTISMTILFEPVGASILAYFILNEKLTASQWVGGTILMTGLFLFLWKKESQEKRPKNLNQNVQT